jgi:hypothetical protein
VLHFAFGGFTTFGCSTRGLAVDTDRRLLTGDFVRSGWKKQPVGDEPFNRNDNGGARRVVGHVLLSLFTHGLDR